MARYKKATSVSENTWYDEDTGETFSPGGSVAYRRFEQWLAENNTVDEEAYTQITPPDAPRANRIRSLVANAKQALNAVPTTTTGERALANIFIQTLEGLAALDPPVNVPTTLSPIVSPDEVSTSVAYDSIDRPAGVE